VTRRVRMSDGEPAALVYARLTGRQRRLMDTVIRSNGEFLTATETAATAQAVLHTAVSYALAERVPAKLLADKLGVSVSRIYQIDRDVNEHMTEDLSGS